MKGKFSSLQQKQLPLLAPTNKKAGKKNLKVEKKTFYSVSNSDLIVCTWIPLRSEYPVILFA